MNKDEHLVIPDDLADGVIIDEIEGDLFSSTDSLCHCVSEDLHMGKGIATVFKTQFGRVDELKRQSQVTGGMAFLHVSNPDRFIYYLVTKPAYFKKPTYGTLESSLKAMRDHMIANNVSRLSMPLIGCGLDRLKWDSVKTILRRVFEGCDVHITVYKLPASSPDNTSTRGGGGSRRGRGRGRGRAK